MQLEELEKEVETVMYDMPKVAKGEKLRKVWSVAKPVLQMLQNSFFIPKKFRLVIATVILGVDELLNTDEVNEEPTA